MAELTTLARPYAKAAFESALASGELASWSKALTLLAAIAEQKEMQLLAAKPNFTAEQKCQAYVDVCGDALDAKQQNLLVVLSKNDRLPLLPKIYELFELYKANQEKSVDVSVETAYELSSKQAAQLQAVLKNTLAREVEVTTKVNEELLGGVFIRAGDTVIDASIRGRLAKLSSAINA